MAAVSLGSIPFFQQCPSIIEANGNLRQPQRDAYQAVREHFANSREPVVVQMPVGSGKTGLISILPFGIANRRVLIVAPNLTIREAIFEAVDSGSKDCFWRKMRVAPLTVEGPFAAKIDGGDTTFADCADSHFVVANVQQLSHAKSKWLAEFPADFFDLILIDEGHHNAAASWRRLMDHFPAAKVVSLTATPFRSDGQALIGKRLYHYPFLRAMCRGYIKSLKAIHVSPTELSFTFRDSAETCSLAELLELKEETWFSRGVALAEECNRSIVATSIQQCEQLRSAKSTKHQVIAAACSVEHAEQVAALYRESGYYAEEIHSKLTRQQRDLVLKRLRSGQLDAIVQVQMLGEGFDHAQLSVAAIFRPFRTLSPYVQFVGRVMRVVRQQRPSDPDNTGVVVSHVGLNTEHLWEDFRLLDENDQQLWAGLVSGTSPANESANDLAEREGESDRRFFSPDMLVAHEILGEVKKQQYGHVQPEPEQVELQFDIPGQISNGPLAGPQQIRREGRARIKQQVEDSIRHVLRSTRLSSTGWQIGYKFRFLRRNNNWAALRFWMYMELNKTLGRKAGAEWTLTEVEEAADSMPLVVSSIEEKLLTAFRRSSSWHRYDRY